MKIVVFTRTARVARIGTVLILAAVILISPWIIVGMVEEFETVIWPLLVLILLAVTIVVCGLCSKPPDTWGVMLAVGFIWMILPSLGLWAAAEYWGMDIELFRLWLLVCLPGFILIAGGVFIKMLRKKKFSPADANSPADNT